MDATLRAELWARRPVDGTRAAEAVCAASAGAARRFVGLLETLESGSEVPRPSHGRERGTAMEGVASEGAAREGVGVGVLEGDRDRQLGALAVRASVSRCLECLKVASTMRMGMVSGVTSDSDGENGEDVAELSSRMRREVDDLALAACIGLRCSSDRPSSSLSLLVGAAAEVASSLASMMEQEQENEPYQETGPCASLLRGESYL